jgi:hypothetical protein
VRGAQLHLLLVSTAQKSGGGAWLAGYGAALPEPQFAGQRIIVFGSNRLRRRSRQLSKHACG